VAYWSKAYICGRWLAEVAGYNPVGAWRFFRCECCVLSGRGLCDELITRPEVSYRLWSVVYGLDTSSMRQWPALGRSAIGKKLHVSAFSGLSQVQSWSLKSNCEPEDNLG